MVTFAQAQERADEWVNGDVPAYQHREVRVREFELGFVVWAEDRADGPVSDGGRQRLVIARDSGEATLWPGLPVGEVIRRYEEEYGGSDAVPAAPEPPQRIDLNQTSFLLSPPEWLQEAADKLGIPDRRAEAGPESDVPAPAGPSAAAAAVAAVPAQGSGPESADAGAEPADARPAGADASERPAAGGVSTGGTPWAGTDTNTDAGSGEGEVALPETVFAPPLSGSDDDGTPPPSVPAEAATALMSGGSQLPRTAVVPGLDPQAGPGTPAPGVPAVPGAPAPPGPPAAPGSVAGDIADAATSKAAVPPRGPRGAGPSAPPPPGVPGAAVPPPGAPGTPAGSYVPTQLVPQQGPSGAPGAPTPPGPPAAPGSTPPPGPPVPPGSTPPPGPPPPPGATPPPGGGVHHAETMLATPGRPGPGVPQPPGPPGPPGAPGGPHTPPPPAYGYPQQPAGQPTVGPGYQAVLRFRAPDGSEQQLIRRSAPGTPHPEWQMLHELRAMNVPPQQVIELHTELESCELPGAYCARMIREMWPQVRITSVAPYGTDHASRQQGMRALLTHQGELHQVADGPARPAPVRAPLPQVPPAPPLPPEALAEETLAAFGPQGVLRFDQRAVSRQGVPETVARTLVWAGLPADFGPFFWAQPGQPVVPTLGELAAQRQVRPAPDAGSYLVMGSDFGRAICVQYGTADIVAVPVEAGPGGQSVPPQFVNSGLPEFVRSMALLGRMWRLRYGLNPEQAGRWTVDFQAQLAALDPAALASPESWWSVLLEQMWDGLL
ncbi:SUKH-4 family immunity protein [Streptomyces sp. NBC_01754]|uniref:SUKH-4 family immunity protein n=1 Tax=Streptomyces sp. NBC_01754 TaxID=2975930 RepID=UPI002DDA4A40|nr:SUKH-4 family immunity protein [Streptomyces sp. NBC_01754]WSC92904.1 SUKH-4 family immunity protein [Streptomyces sp. NBC_01754]